jgi:hypothetical protein
MCTVTFAPRRTGYVLGMNRDEQLTRVTARPPTPRFLEGRRVLFPSEPGGGTWIGLNDAGVCLALINWYSVTARVPRHALSRGCIVTSAIGETSYRDVAEKLTTIPLPSVNPFRLIGIFPGERKVVEWRWNLHQLTRQRYPWKANTWISSGHDEPGAQLTRAKNFRAALRQTSAGSLAWLRRLHRCHQPERGPYSTCMHRADAATVSYTEVICTAAHSQMRYHAGSPCLRIHQLPKSKPQLLATTR